MRGQEASPVESEYGFSGPHLMGLGGLVAGIGLVLWVFSPPLDGPKENPRSTGESVATDFQASAETYAPVEPVMVTRAVEPPVKPAVAERLPRPSWQPAPPAVAEKRPIDFWDSKMPAPLTERELEAYLAKSVPTVGLDIDQAKKAVKHLLAEKRILPQGLRTSRSIDRLVAKTSTEMLKEQKTTFQELIDAGDIEGLPFAEKSACELELQKAHLLENYSRMLHTRIGEIDRAVQNASKALSFGSAFPITDRSSALAHAIGETTFQFDEAIPALVQILEVEPEMVREQLVDRLSNSQSTQATQFLADRAVFDLSPVVRHHASQALRGRPAEDFRPKLLKALHYPWPAAAWHAAEALVATNDKDAVPELVRLLDDPDPSKPFRDESGKMMVRELVRLNHFQNCLVCHAPSRQKSDLVQASIPVPGESIRPVYYGSHFRSGLALVRADVTYLRQDFSVMHSVEDSKPWPNRQRFDYLVRTRKATPEEVAAEAVPPQSTEQYPQREAVLYALRKLTGRNAGNSVKAWRRMTTLD